MYAFKKQSKNLFKFFLLLNVTLDHKTSHK